MFLALSAVSHSELVCLLPEATTERKEMKVKLEYICECFFCFIYEAIAYGLQAMILNGLSIVPNPL
jgi:hypothetical protein